MGVNNRRAFETPSTAPNAVLAGLFEECSASVAATQSPSLPSQDQFNRSLALLRTGFGRRCAFGGAVSTAISGNYISHARLGVIAGSGKKAPLRRGWQVAAIRIELVTKGLFLRLCFLPLEQPALRGVSHHLGAISQMQFLQNIFHMILDRILAQT